MQTLWWILMIFTNSTRCGKTNCCDFLETLNRSSRVACVPFNRRREQPNIGIIVSNDWLDRLHVLGKFGFHRSHGCFLFVCARIYSEPLYFSTVWTVEEFLGTIYLCFWTHIVTIIQHTTLLHSQPNTLTFPEQISCHNTRWASKSWLICTITHLWSIIAL